MSTDVPDAGRAAAAAGAQLPPVCGVPPHLRSLGRGGVVAEPLPGQIACARAWGRAQGDRILPSLLREGYAQQVDAGGLVLIGTPLVRHALAASRRAAVCEDGMDLCDRLLVQWMFRVPRAYAGLLSDLLLGDPEYGFLPVLRQGRLSLRPEQVKVEAAPWSWWARWRPARAVTLKACYVWGRFALDAPTDFCLYQPPGLGPEVSVSFALGGLS